MSRGFRDVQGLVGAWHMAPPPGAGPAGGAVSAVMPILGVNSAPDITPPEPSEGRNDRKFIANVGGWMGTP